MTNIIIIIWLIGIIVAWFQIKYWNGWKIMIFPRDYILLAFLSLLSWAIYPISAIEEIINRIKTK